MADRNTLLKQIGEISFFLDDMKLFLDTHPTDEKGLDSYQKYAMQRKQLLKQYADEFEPLTCDCICLESNGGNSGTRHWTWSDGPVPWDREANAFAMTTLSKTGGM